VNQQLFLLPENRGSWPLQSAIPGQRTQVYHDSIRHKHTAYFIQGMDHAFMRNSSEGPGENGNLEFLFYKWKLDRIGADE